MDEVLEEVGEDTGRGMSSDRKGAIALAEVEGRGVQWRLFELEGNEWDAKKLKPVPLTRN